MRNNTELIKLRAQHVPQGVFNTHPMFVKEAKGAVIVDVDGR